MLKRLVYLIGLFLPSMVSAMSAVPPEEYAAQVNNQFTAHCGVPFDLKKQCDLYDWAQGKTIWDIESETFVPKPKEGALSLAVTPPFTTTDCDTIALQQLRYHFRFPLENLRGVEIRVCFQGADICSDWVNATSEPVGVCNE